MLLLSHLFKRRRVFKVPMAATREGTSSSNRTHSERTSDSYRSQGLYNVLVTDITQLSPTVKGYSLKCIDSNETSPTFKAGQWLDVHTPSGTDGDIVIGGYSLTCFPNQSTHQQLLTLAIQYSTHTPTHWMHTQCTIGTRLNIRVGGDFYYSPSPLLPLNLLLIAGGIGINPIYSIMGHQYNLLRALRDTEHSPPPSHSPSPSLSPSLPRTHLLYSARNSQELIFKDNIIEWCQKLPDLLSVKFFVTQEDHQTSSSSSLNDRPTNNKDCNNEQQQRRIDLNDISDTFNNHSLPIKDTHCYICGPPPFINDMTLHLGNIGVDKEHIHFEKWW